MAGTDLMNASMRRASAARATAAAAAARGDQTMAVRASSAAAWALRAAHRSTPPSDGSARVAATRWEAPTFDAEVAPLLIEYAELWAAYLAPGGGGEMPARLIEIGQQSPDAMEAYARVLLVSYEDPLLSCPGG